MQKYFCILNYDLIYKKMTQFILDTFSNMGYIGLIIMMTINFSFIPFPSEIVVPPAGYLASTGEFNLFLVILCCTLGSLLGATFNYFFALYLGRAVVYKFIDSKFTRLMMLNSQKLKKAEDYFNQYGKSSVFIGCLIPAIRQLISLPAGLAKMHFPSFIALTTFGAAIWTTILALLGYFVGENQELWESYLKEITFTILGILVVGLCIYLWKKLR